jgi:hypothetical protein
MYVFDHLDKAKQVQCCSEDVLTADSRHVFSRSAPTQPVKPMINVTLPRKERAIRCISTVTLLGKTFPLLLLKQILTISLYYKTSISQKEVHKHSACHISYPTI